MIDKKECVNLLLRRINSDIRDRELAVVIGKYIIRIINEVFGNVSLWKDPETELPKNMDFVLAIITGRAGGIQCGHAPAIASYAPDDGWMLVELPDRADDSWTVDKWMYIPE